MMPLIVRAFSPSSACFNAFLLAEMRKITGGVIQNITSPSRRSVLSSYINPLKFTYVNGSSDPPSPRAATIEVDDLEIVIPLPGGATGVRRRDLTGSPPPLKKSSRGKKVRLWALHRFTHLIYIALI